MPASLDDYRWLVSPEAEPFLRKAGRQAGSLNQLTSELRGTLSAERTHLVLEQAELRRRAADKFGPAERMFFTRQRLEQATDEQIATYKAQRFTTGKAVADLCCGIGGDLLALGRRGPVVGVERDAATALLADANCRIGALADWRIEIGDVQESLHWLEARAWHIDPDRRAVGTRSSQPQWAEPGMDVLQQLGRRVPAGAIKLAPAAELPYEFEGHLEREWIGSRGECRQQVIWVGELARHADRRVATSINRAGAPCSFAGHAHEECELGEPARYLFDVDATVRAAGLSGALAKAFQLRATNPRAAYLTADRIPDCGLLSAFEVHDVLPLDVKRLRAIVRQRRLGPLEIKVRGVRVDPRELRRQVRPTGDKPASLLVFRLHRDVRVAITSRCDACPDEDQ